MKKIFLLLLIIASSTASAVDHRLTKDQFLQRIESGLELDRAPLISGPPPMIAYAQQKQRAQFPNFRDEMIFTFYLKTDSFIYTVFYDWTLSQCQLRIEEIDKSIGKPNAQMIDPVGQPIDKKYCEKLYGLRL